MLCQNGPIHVLVRCMNVFAACLLLTAPLHAADDPPSDEVPRLDPLIVSATKTPVPLSQLTSAAEVITAKDIEQRHIRTVVDALRLSQGTAVFSNGGPGTSANVRIRGGNARQTLVLIDGAIVNSATVGSFNFAHLTSDNIETIEIIRGAQSLTWGADAMTGVISITTKRGKGPWAAGGFFEYGSFNTLREGITVSGKTGPFDLAASLSRWDSSGFSAINYRRGATEADSYRNWQASTLVGLDLPKDGRFDFLFRWWNGDTDIDSSFGPSDVIKASNNSEEFVFSGTYTQPLTNWYTHVLTLSRAQESSPFNPGISQRNLSTNVVSVPFGGPNETRTRSDRIESQHNFYLGEHTILTGGYQFRSQRGKNDTGLSKKTLSSHAGFAQVQVNLFDRIFGNAGVRHDDFNTFGSRTTYRVSGGYLHQETNTKIRTSYATAFRAPTVNELFFPNFGNPNLDPEKSRSVDVGIDQQLFSNRVTISGGYFYNRFRDLIQTIQSAAICGTGPFGANFCPVNVAKARTQGVEASLSVLIAKDLPWVKRLELQGHYTYTATRDLGTKHRLARWPLHQGGLRIHYQPIDPLNILMDFRIVGRQFNDAANTQRVGGFTVVNLSASYDINATTEVYTRVDNLFDEQYEEILFFGTPVRSIYGGVRVNFKIPMLSES